MKIYSYRHFFVGLFFLVMGVGSVWTINLNFKDTFDWLELGKSLFYIIIAFGVAVEEFYSAFFKKGLKKAQLEEEDERNQYIKQSLNAMIGKIAYNMIWGLSIIFVILWAIFKINTLMWLAIVFSMLFTTLMFISIGLAFYYEKKF
ncbi:hypothetical protein ACVPPR_07825 [Dellaglioa sp. L3N]